MRLLQPKYAQFSHPEMLRGFNYDELKSINVLRYGGGGVVSAFESSWSEYTGIKHSVSVNSGTSGLYAAYIALGLKSGDEVIVSNYNFFAAATPLIHIGCKVVLVDCDDYGNISVESILENLSSRVKAIVVTHLWGRPADIKAISDIAKRTGIRLIEDCSHAHGSRVGNTIVGNFGDISVWSMGAKKTITGGIGGMISTNDDNLHEKLVLFCHYGEVGVNMLDERVFGDIVVTGNGINLRMHPYAAHLCLKQLSNLEHVIDDRNRSLALFKQTISEIDEVYIPECSERHSLYSSTLCFNKEQSKSFIVAELLPELDKRGVDYFDTPGTTRPLSEFDLFSGSFADLNHLSNSYRYHNSIIKFSPWYGEECEEYAMQVGRVFVNTFKSITRKRVY